jgi:Flp pilus assembly protein TadD
MAKSTKSAAPPRGLLLLGAIGAVAAVAYAFLSSPPTGAPPQNRPPAAGRDVLATEQPPSGASLQTLIATGNARMDSGQYLVAIRYYTRALELDSGQVDVWVDRGASRHALGDGEGARGDFQRALALHPGHPIAMFNMGVAYMTDGQEDSARAWWNQLLALQPTGIHADRARELLAHLDSLDRVQTP